MPIATRYLFIVSMDVAEEKEALFNEVYDSEHIPNLLSVPGVVSATRSIRVPLVRLVDGEERVMDPGGEPRYAVVYEIEDPDVLLSREWVEAGERGRWPTEVRPFTTNRRHILRQVLS